MGQIVQPLLLLSLLFNKHLTPTGDQTLSTEIHKTLTLSQALRVLASKITQNSEGDQYSAETLHVLLMS